MSGEAHERTFIVVQQGVYRHDIAGPYPTLEDATAAAADMAATDRDGYHEYEIHELDHANPGSIPDTPTRIVAYTNPTCRKDDRSDLGYWDGRPCNTIGSPRSNPTGLIARPRVASHHVMNVTPSCAQCDLVRERQGRTHRVGEPCDICDGTDRDFVGRTCRHCFTK